MIASELVQNDCLVALSNVQSQVDLVYLDPPFMSQKIHKMTTRCGDAAYEFADIWSDNNEYMRFMYDRLLACKNAMNDTGSIFVHCDKNSSHYLRAVCDAIFGPSMFRAEIIWSYKRWSNSSKGLLPAHQNILYYTKSKEYKFHKKYVGYSEATNVDQILQNRSRDARNKSVYARDKDGNVITSGEKRGVPLGDVWEIPYLNPKAKERVGYPTQKPIALLERIIELTTDEGDLVLDPFCGSGTTLVAAKLMGRRFFGIDVSSDAIALASKRLAEPVKTSSSLMEKGRKSYDTSDARLQYFLQGIEFTPVARNLGIDAILSEKVNGDFVFVRLQKDGEDLEVGTKKLIDAVKKRGGGRMVFVANETIPSSSKLDHDELTVVSSVASQVRDALRKVMV